MNSYTSSSKPVVIRQVWSRNLKSEFLVIRQLIDCFPFISMDTEFPDLIYQSVDPTTKKTYRLLPSDLFKMLKSNVDALNLIQVGFTLTNFQGNLPHLDTANQFIWEFNFKYFDIKRDEHAPDSIAMLRKQVIDFKRNQENWIDSTDFAELMISSGLVCNDSVTWVTFHSTYDFGYLVKVLTCQSLPGEMEDFLRILRVLFGKEIYDIKHMMSFYTSLYGGLDRVARTLEVDRVVGKCH